MGDILFHTDKFVFSYRVAGILLRNNKILLQKPTNDAKYAIPGGHVGFGETNAQTLIREFKEEIEVDITVGALKWVAESFFPWGDKSCHQICLYYEIALKDETQIGGLMLFYKMLCDYRSPGNVMEGFMRYTEITVRRRTPC